MVAVEEGIERVELRYFEAFSCGKSQKNSN
jgi:hypothetical protein